MADGEWELTETCALSQEQEIRARALETATPLVTQALATDRILVRTSGDITGGVAALVVKVARDFAAWIEHGDKEPPA